MREAVTSVRGTVGEGSLTALQAPGRYAYLCSHQLIMICFNKLV